MKGYILAISYGGVMQYTRYHQTLQVLIDESTQIVQQDGYDEDADMFIFQLDENGEGNYVVWTQHPESNDE